jgi:membrane associated rhomboid family serine protease
MLPIKDTIPSRNPPIMTHALILVNAIAFFFQLTMPERTLEQFVYLFGIVPARYTHPAWAEYVGFPVDDYLPFLTHMFLHGGWLHIISNMWSLSIFGDNVEDRMGPFRFLIFYLLCGLAAGLTHLLTNANSTVPSVGASGAIAGVLAAYFLWFWHSRVIVLIPIIIIPFFFELPAFFYLGFWFVSQLFSGTAALLEPQQGGGIAWWAHIGGFVAGVLFCWAFLRPQRERRRFEPDEYGIETPWVTRREWQRF